MFRIRKNLKLLFFLGFLQSLAIALPFYIQSSFLNQFMSVGAVSWFFIVAMLAAMIAIDIFPYFVTKFSNYKTSLVVLFTYFLATFLLAFSQARWLIFVLFVLLVVSRNLLIIALDLFVEKLSSNQITGQIRTFLYTLVNFSWIISSLIISFGIGKDNYGVIFVSTAVAALLVLIILLFKRADYQDHLVYKHQRHLLALKNIWRSLNLRGIFMVALILEIFYATFVIYMPIYLHQELGFSWGVIGIMFAVMLIPFILIEIPAGILADKYIGEKEMIIFGMLILAVVCFSIFVVDSVSPWVWGAIFFFSRCGAALVEAMRETYFFKMVDVEDVDYINLFRVIFPLGYLLAPLLGIIILRYYPLNCIFLFLGIVLVAGIYFAARLKDTK